MPSGLIGAAVGGIWLQAELEQACKVREQLVLAERLFDMDITSYPCLGQVEAEMRKLQQVYAVYQEHADCVRQYGCMLWSELDVAGMMKGTEEVRCCLGVVFWIFEQITRPAFRPDRPLPPFMQLRQ